MSVKQELHVGDKIERWTLLEAPKAAGDADRKWLCRCECGTERYVMERSLRYRTSKSCGCLRREQSGNRKVITQIEGKTYGELTVLHKSENPHKNGGIWWTCRCACGELYDVPGSLLVTGRKTHCSSKIHTRKTTSVDITGKRFHRLVALYPLEERDKRNYVIWRCRCDCGKEIDIAYNTLVYCKVKSCGCQKKEHAQSLSEYLTHVDGTSLDILKSDKIPTNNTTGAKGVYHIRGQWVAKIVFQKKAYYLGRYENYQDAVNARRAAEEEVRTSTLEYYERWKAKAEADPAWAEANPIKIQMEKNMDNTIRMLFEPVLD